MALKVVLALPLAAAECFCVPGTVPSMLATGHLREHFHAVTQMALPHPHVAEKIETHVGMGFRYEATPDHHVPLRAGSVGTALLDSTAVGIL